jgi:hypothetical protein
MQSVRGMYSIRQKNHDKNCTVYLSVNSNPTTPFLKCQKQIINFRLFFSVVMIFLSDTVITD